MTKHKDNQGAINALKGMRAQFLYTLYRILNASEQESYFRPEGEYEDLEILDEKKRIIEAIQIKDLNTTVTLSDILPKGKEGLIKRGLEAHKMGHNTIIRLISFSDINTEIKELSKKNHSQRLTKKLKEKGLQEKDIEVLQKHFKYDVFKKDELIATIAQKLIESRYFANIEITTNLLVYWIYISAEKQQTIGKYLLRDRFVNIGSFLTTRESFTDTFNHLILPLKNTIKHENRETLKTEFFQGISAKYDHILAELDVKRNEKLESIRTAFRTNNVMLIHGASGQGKSTLAYRFLKDYCDSNTAFEIKLPPDFPTVYKVINALEGISEGLGFPMTLYIDIAPGNKDWVYLISELSAKKNFHFLISIREEDWHSVEVSDKFLFSEIELKMDKAEAKEIYDGLDRNNLDERFTGFDEAWQQFGEEGPLLEFVYLITQTQSLKSKIKFQVTQLTNDINSKDKVEVLRYVSLADSFGARIKYKEFFQKQGIRNPRQIIHQLKEEYLVQTAEDDAYLVGLHPIRSSLIKDELFDPILEEEAKYALQSLSFISDNTLLDFLRNSFAHANLNVHELLAQLPGFKPTSWQAYYQILKSLLWKGLSDYLQTNKELLDQVYEKVGIGWITMVSFDFANVIESGNMVESSSVFPEEAKVYAREMNSKFSPKDEVFNYCRKWLEPISTINIQPMNNFDWDAFGIFLFWVQHLEVKSIQFNLEKFDFETLFREYPIDKLGQIIYSLKSYNDQTKEAEQKVDQIFVTRFYNEFKVFYFEESNERLECKYITDIEANNFETEEKDIFHARTMRIIELLRLAYPYSKSYAVKGFGHKFSFIPDDYDSSEKKISQAGLPLYQLTKLNTTYINLYNYSQRPIDWADYVESIIEQRQLFSMILGKLVESYNLAHKQKNWLVLANFLKEYSEKYEIVVKKSSKISLPKTLIDEWGEFSDGSGKNKQSAFDQFSDERGIVKQSELDQKHKNEPQIRRFILPIKKYDDFVGYYDAYFSSVQNFLQQCYQSLYFKLFKDISEIKNIARVSVGNLFKSFESLNDFQIQFRNHFEKFVDPFQLCQLEKKETEFVSSLCFIWKQYLYDTKFINDKKNISSLALDKMRETKSTFQNRLNTELQKFAKEKGVEVNIDFDEKHKRCFILTNANDIFSASSMFQDIYELLFSAIGSPEYTSIKFLMLSTNFERFYLIQLYHGKTFKNQWHEFRLFNLREKHANELEPHCFISSAINSDVVERYNLKSWNEVSEEIGNMQKMVDSISIASQLGYHLIQFDDLETDDSEIGLEIAKSYISEKLVKFTTHLQEGLSLFTKCIEFCNNNANEIATKVDLSELTEIFRESLNLFYPNEVLGSEYRFSEVVNIKLLQQWIPRLEKLVPNLVSIHLLSSSIIVDKILHSPSATLLDENLAQ